MGVWPREGASQEPGASFACFSSVGADPSGVKLLDDTGVRLEGSNPKDDDEGVELELDDDSRR